MAASTFPYASQLRSQGREEGHKEGHKEGLAEGRAQAIITILDDRAIALEDADRQRVLGCTDMERLDTWLHRALRVATISELFAE
jgi:hypothetical protein